MKKLFRKSIILLFIISISICTFKYYYVFAENSNIVEINGSAKIGSDVKININLKNITYENYTVKLTSSDSVNNITNLSNIEAVNSNNKILFTISKSESNLSVISLNYKVPETISVNSKITFKVEIINTDNEAETINVEKFVTIVEDSKPSNDNSNSNSNSNTNSNVNNKPTNSNGNVNSNTNNNKPINTNNKQTNISKPSTTNIVQKTVTYTNVVKQVSNVPKVTYNGSDNNYLSKLVVSNYYLNKDFTKENTNYFVTVDNKVTKITIKATAEDSDSHISINGNDNLQVGVNKVLITVTAENGNTRNYRIYVTRKSE